MRFNKLDLNLLVALDALLTERSVTAAAERLHLSPSAMSNSLSRLREYFGDDLLVRIGRRMEITPRAAQLQDAVRDVLIRIDSTLAANPGFEPRGSERVFRVFASDYTQLVLGPHLMRLACAQGSTVRFEFLPQVNRPQQQLSRGEADLLIIPSVFVAPDQPEQRLYEEKFACVVWRDSPLAQGAMTAERYAAAEHIVMRPPTTAEAFEATVLRHAGIQRKAAVVTYCFAALPALVVGTDYVATVHASLARQLARSWPVVVRPAPLPNDTMVQVMQWHHYRTQDPGLVWLRGLVTQAAQALMAED